MQVCLDGSVFFLKPQTGVTRTPLQEWPQNIRLDGQQLQKDRSNLSSWALDSFKNGFGIDRQNTNLSEHNYRLWDAENVDTRFPNQVILSPLFVTCTIVPSRGDLGVVVPYLNNLYFVETNRYGTLEDSAGGTGNPAIAYAYQFAAPQTVGSNSIFANILRGGALGSIQAFGNLSQALAIGNRLFMVADVEVTGTIQADKFFSCVGIGGTVSGTLGQSNLILVSGTRSYISPQIAELGGTIHVLYHDIANQQYKLFNFDQTGLNLANPKNINSVAGSYSSPMDSDGAYMFVYVHDGIYDFDTTPAKIIDVSRSPEINPMLTMFGNELYFKHRNSLMRYDGSVITNVGCDRDSGLPNDKLGQTTALTSSWQWLFAAVQGATYSHILTMDRDYKWQYFARVPSTGVWVKQMLLNSSPDGIDRLWLLFGNAPQVGYFLNPLANPLMVGTYSYVPTGHITSPIYDGGLSDVNAGFFDVVISGKSVGSATPIKALFGIDGANPAEVPVSVTTGGTASASNEEATQPASEAFDGDRDLGSAWEYDTFGSGQWLQYDFGSGVKKIIKQYRIYVTGFSSRAPYTWTFEGSNDGSTWAILDTHVADLLRANTWENFFIKNTTGYRYYRLNVTQLFSGNIIQVNELVLLENYSYPLGDSVSNSTTLLFGSPYGLEGREIQEKFILSNLNVSGTTPVFVSALTHYLKDPSKRSIFDFTVDIKQTARSVGKPAEAILATLSAIESLRTLVPFWYGQVGTKAVKILDMPSEEEVMGIRPLEGEREGFIHLRLSEM